ncbi:hypothetical protein MNL06_06090 [Bartonella krasnovii]|uniref:hypothetical protein n=1 Tax=Bartonella krasnovii TaxID=2267275 RepID=UPI001F4C9CA5|nr:hypothetical protein [Bartonella krasnovii]UNF45121.1 hypothetical protein MNL06_06080 [Bartonella krasnovii]UNF45122.1 hypothetical protein MNL06_06085 [Bartonella krasnovii]UNF45123.1 hypothetical protein MNL06_06090 [Bartonella krasnovii]
MIKINSATSGGKDKQIFATLDHKRENAPIPPQALPQYRKAHAASTIEIRPFILLHH